MCVVALVESVRPSDEQIRQMWDQNSKGGGGAAWRDVMDGVRVVRWKKGLNKDEMVALNTTLPFPYVLHFRQPSHDTSDSLLATHPFQIDEDATSEFEGVVAGWVLFHNGYWNEWRKKLEAIAMTGFKKLPSGAWSDTRGLAWASHYLGFGFLEMVNERVLCLGPEELDIEMFGGPWLAVKGPSSEKTFVVSNRTWERVSYTVHDRRSETSKLLTAAHEAVSGKVGGTSQVTSFPGADERASYKAGAEGNQQKRVQTEAQGSVQGDDTSIDGTLGDEERHACANCTKMTRVGQIILNQWLCYQCWSKHNKISAIGASDQSGMCWVGTCQRCRAGSSGMKTVLGDEWLCHACWETNGKPKIYYAKDRAP